MKQIVSSTGVPAGVPAGAGKGPPGGGTPAETPVPLLFHPRRVGDATGAEL
ncbi:hypothetical protein [Telmatospirillum sp.]|uniref:hypothetical protein n=1 Tax=Telmatospirillum sp. TaxID=2079197 RepID=UPI002852C1AE|nr:hypothetical protein [Telmatospirillum sp.]